MNNRRVAVASLLSLVLIGCGGGPSVSPPTQPVTTPTQPVSNGTPAITALTPSSATAGASGLSVTVTGSSFLSTSVVQWNGAAVPTTYTSTSSLTAAVPASDLANGAVATVAVNNPAPNGGTSASASFVVNNPLPVVKGVTPASVMAGSGPVALDLTGSGFVPSSIIHWNGGPLPTTVVSSTELKATLPAADVAGSAAEMVTVSNPSPGGGASATISFNVTSPTPAVTSISPQTVTAGAAATITIMGTGFEIDSTVLWNGLPRPTTFVNATTLLVALSATNLQAASVGSLAVSNPGPGGSVSGAASLTVTSQQTPSITGVTITSVAGPAQCAQLQATITGTHFAGNASIQVNGKTLPNPVYIGDLSNITGYLPAGFVSKPGGLSFTVTNPAPAPVTSAPFAYPATSPPVLAVCPTPSPTTVFPSSTFTVTVTPTEVNSSGGEQVATGPLPPGITVSTPALSMPAGGASFHFQAAASTAAGNDNVVLNASDGAATATATLALTVSSGTLPAIYLSPAQPGEVGVPIGGSGSTQFICNVNAQNVDFDITPSVSGLPPGTTASFSPSVVSPSQSFTITLTAAATAPVTQNATVTATATPSAAITPATGTFLADVTQPPGGLPNSRTDFTPTAGTPFAAVYDPVHDLIFSSNPAWNRVDVISNGTHKIVKSIPIIDPRGLDITLDSARVWVSTDTTRIYSLNTTTLAATLYTLPSVITSGDTANSNNHDRLLALADGTVFLYFNDDANAQHAGVWDPVANTYTNLNGTGIVLYPQFGIPSRSGDGTVVYAPSSGTGGLTIYSTVSKTVTNVSGVGPGTPLVAVNKDGTRILAWLDTVKMYDQNLNLIGTVPGTLGTSIGYLLGGGAVFSPDQSKIYEVGYYDGLNVVLTIDAASLQVLGVAPAAFTVPVGSSGEAGTATPIAVDANGMVLGIQNYGISFDDSTFVQNYATNQPGFNGSSEYIATFAGPLSGGTSSSLYVSSPLTPDVWFGQSRGTASIAQPELSFMSPPSTVPGPVNLKFIYPDGTQGFYPQLFSYSTYPQYAVFSGSSPQGGGPSAVIGYGMPQSSTGGTLTVGNNAGTITTTVGQYPPFSGEPYPSTILNYNFPPGSNGFADLQIQTPIGTGSLPKSIYYARSVTDYASSDTFTSVLLDPARNQVYLTAGDHVDVFSTTSNRFLGPIYPAATKTTRQFTGLALTPDGSQLLVTDMADGSLAVVNPDVPANTFAIPVAPETLTTDNCPVGPLYVAATANQKAFVTTGGLPQTNCSQTGLLYIADLVAKTAARPPIEAQCNLGIYSLPFTDALSVSASSDGNYLTVGGTGYSSACIYSVASATYAPVSLPYGHDASISGDGNVLAGWNSLADTSGRRIGDVAQPIPLYPDILAPGITGPPPALYRSLLNASGSLHYVAYPNYFEIVDVLHARLLMRFSLTETVQSAPSPIAIDAGGRYVYLITDKGLTVVDLGEAPLAIGHMTQQLASPGTQVTVRGSGFDSSLTATIGGQAAALSIGDQNTLTITVPAAASGPQDIVLSRGDGASYTLENGITLP